MTPPTPAGWSPETRLEWALLWSSPAAAGWTTRADRHAAKWLAMTRCKRGLSVGQRAQRRRLEVQLGLWAPPAHVAAAVLEADRVARAAVGRHRIEGPVDDRVEDDESEGVRA